MPTDQDWGRLYNYDTTGDAGLVMPPRSYYFRNFYPGGWNELVAGMIYRNSGLANDNADVVDERQSETSSANLFHFGLTQSNGATVQVASNPFFLGIRGVRGGTSQISISPLQLANLKLVSVNNFGNTVAGVNMAMPLKQGVQANPFSMIGIRFMVNQEDERVYLKYAIQQDVALADDAANITTLSTFLNSISRVIGEADAAFPFYNITNLNAFYIYWPYLNNRLMLQTVGALKIA